MASVNPTLKEVCKICFNASSQKSNPTLVTSDRVLVDGKAKSCPSCKQTWTSAKVAFDNDQRRWVSIRPRSLKMNPVIDYTLCNSLQRKVMCGKGQGVCTFAHSQAELNEWNRERWSQEPRPVPYSGTCQFQLCQNVVDMGMCQYGQKCTYAHSEVELQRWTNSIRVSSQHHEPFSDNTDYYCKPCDIRCTSRQQYEDHISGIRHRQVVSSNQGPRFTVPTHRPPQPRFSQIRPRPNHVPLNGFKLCNSIAENRRCFYGDRCSFAHSDIELDAWNTQKDNFRCVL